MLTTLSLSVRTLEHAFLWHRRLVQAGVMAILPNDFPQRFDVMDRWIRRPNRGNRRWLHGGFTRQKRVVLEDGPRAAFRRLVIGSCVRVDQHKETTGPTFAMQRCTAAASRVLIVERQTSQVATKISTDNHFGRPPGPKNPHFQATPPPASGEWTVRRKKLPYTTLIQGAATRLRRDSRVSCGTAIGEFHSAITTLGPCPRNFVNRFTSRSPAFG